jgi:hypothetical protein
MTTDERIVETFDRELGQLHGLPGVTSTKQATVRHVGMTESSTYIVQTFRRRDVVENGEKAGPSRDTIFLEYIGPGGRSLRLVLPSGVADTIARQRDQLGAINRRKGARQAVATRKERGIQPGFLKNPGRRRKRTAARASGKQT